MHNYDNAIILACYITLVKIIAIDSYTVAIAIVIST